MDTGGERAGLTGATRVKTGDPNWDQVSGGEGEFRFVASARYRGVSFPQERVRSPLGVPVGRQDPQTVPPWDPPQARGRQREQGTKSWRHAHRHTQRHTHTQTHQRPGGRGEDRARERRREGDTESDTVTSGKIEEKERQAKKRRERERVVGAERQRRSWVERRRDPESPTERGAEGARVETESPREGREVGSSEHGVGAHPTPLPPLPL